MTRPRVVRQLAGSLAALALVATPAAVQAAQTPTHDSASAGAALIGADVTNAKEAKRVDGYRTPKPDTFDCTEVIGVRSECGTVKLPLDYDRPTGTTTEVAYLRIPAKDQKNKIGTLFLNPGGPGGSGIDIASAAPFFLSPAVLKKFDVVGVDPRGINFSDNVRCFKNIGAQASGLSGLNVAFPTTTRETNAYLQSSMTFAKACSSTGKPLSAHMSTANVARDMDVMRRMFGDKQLTYLGFSYGSYLGNVYANLFPDRVRAVTIDGVLDPVAWAGTPATQRTPVTARIRSGEGGTKAVNEILRLCTKKGSDYCLFASKGDPKRNYDKIIREIKKNPVEITDFETGEVFFTLTYADLVSFLLGDMYDPFAPEIVDSDLTFFYEILFEEFDAGSAEGQAQADLQQQFVDRYQERQAEADAAQAAKSTLAKELGFAFPYYNEADSFQTVLCTDSINPKYVGNWRQYADRAASTGTGFGRLWTWGSAPCAEKYWTVDDGDAYRGSFTAKTKNPVLVVGNYWDPATNYDGAVRAASLLPNSRLLSSDNFGHTAYGTSACVNTAIDTYLLTAKVPKAGTRCRTDFPAFTEPYYAQEGEGARKTVTPDEIQKDAEEEAGITRELPPVVPPMPGAIPRG
ncbi:MAG: alpha/beta hydrolase [Ornithinimicrobium sp.]